MDEHTKDRNKSSNSTKPKDFHDLSLSSDNIISMAGTQLYSTIAQAEFKETSEEPVEDVDKKKIREKTRKDKIRQGIHKLSELLPDNYHTKEGQKETLVSILEKAAEFMSNITKPNEPNEKTGECSSDKISTDVLKEFKDGLDNLKADKDLGSEMEAALSVMAGSIGDHDHLESSSLKLGGNNNNTMDIITNENQDTNINLGSSQGTNDKSLLQNNSSLNMQGLGDPSFMSGMGSGMFGDGPLLPSLMSPMLPGNAMGGMLGSFPSISSNLMQNNGMGNSNVNSSGSNNTQSNLTSSHQNFNGFNQDNLFLSPSSVNSGTPGGNSTVSNQSASLLDNSLQNSNMSSQPQQAPLNNVKIENHPIVKSENQQDPTLLQLPFSNVTSQSSVGLSVMSQGNSDNKSASVLYTQASNVQNVNTNVINSSGVLSSANNLNSNMTVAPQINVGNNFLGIAGSSIGSFNVGQQQNVQTVGNVANNVNLVTVSSSNNTQILAAPPKGVTNIMSNNMPVIGQQQVGTLQQQQTINQNVVMPQMQGTPVGPLQGTLVLHNNQLILVPNNQQQMMNTGLTINQNLQGNIINQSALQNQGVITGLQNLPGTGMQNVVNSGTIQSANQIQGTVIGSGMQNIITTSQAQNLQKQGGNSLAGTVPRIGFNQQQQVVGNTGIIQTNQGTIIQAGIQQNTIPVANPQPAPTAQGGTATVNINTPGGVVQMNTAPSAPNQLPSALILPNGQIVPVVTQPSVINQQQQQQTVLQPQTGGMVIQGSQIPANQGNQLTIQTPGNNLGNNQIIGPLHGGTGLLMTTSMTQGVKSNTITTMANASLKPFHTQTNNIQISAGSSFALNNAIKGPVLVPSKSTSMSHPKTAISKASASSSSSTKTSSMSKSSKSSSKSNKKLVTNLPTTVQAMLTPEGNIILSLPPGANPGSVLGKPLTPVTTTANAGKLPISKKSGQRIIMPKPVSGAPVATIAPLLPGQPTNIIVTSSIATPTMVSTVGLAKGGSGHLTPNQMNPNSINTNINPLSMAVAGSMPNLQNINVSAPSLCSQAVSVSRHHNIASVSTDILAKAAESIFEPSPGGAISPGFYNNANDDNPLQIDDTSTTLSSDIQHNNQMMDIHSHRRSDMTLNTSSTHSVNQGKSDAQNIPPGNGGAKPKVPKPKDASKPSKPKKKSNKDNKTSKANQKKANDKNQSPAGQFLASTDFPNNSDIASNFSMGTDHFMPDLADSLDDGDDESDINDFQDLIRLHEPKVKTIPSIAQESNSLSQIINMPTSSSDTISPRNSILQSSKTEDMMKSTVVTESVNSIPENVTVSMLNTSQSNYNVISDANSSSTSMSKVSSIDLVSSWINKTLPTMSADINVTQPSISESNLVIPSTDQAAVSPVSTLVSEQENEPKYTLSPSIMSSEKVPAVTSLVGTITSESIQSSSESILQLSPPVPLPLGSSASLLPSEPTDLMGLTPMEIIQSIAESSGNEKIEKNPKENKETSPRISQRKLAKAGKGPPPSVNGNSSRSPKRTEQSKSPKRSEQSKSPKRQELSKSPRRLSVKSDITDFYGVDRVAEPAKENSTGVVENNVLSNPLTSNISKQSPKKEMKKSPKKDSKKQSPKKEAEKQLTPANKSPKQTLFVNEELAPEPTTVVPDIPTTKTHSSVGKKRVKSKERSKIEKQNVTKQALIDDYPDEPPTLEREEPFPLCPPPKITDQQIELRLSDKDQSSKNEKKKDENIFMNAIISEKKDYFGTGPSLFSQSGMNTIPPFTNASLPPPPFGFGAPYFRFPMMNNSAGMAGFQHHLPLFAQAPPLFSNNFGEVPFKFPENTMSTSPRGNTSFGNSDTGNKSPRSTFLGETMKDKKESDSNKTKMTSDSTKESNTSSSGKHKKKSKKEKKKEKQSKSSVVELESKPDKQTSDAEKAEMLTSSGMTSSEVCANRLNIASSPRRNIVASEESSVIDVMPSSEVAPTSLGSSIFPEATSDISEKGSKRKKVKKKKKDRRKRDKSESEYEFEIVQHTVINDNESVTVKQPEEKSPIDVSMPEKQSEIISEKGHKSRSRSKKRSAKAEQVNKMKSIPQSTNTQEDHYETEKTNLEFEIENTSEMVMPIKDRKTYSLRGRGMSPKGTIEDPTDDFCSEQKQIQEPHVTIPDEYFPMAKISPLKQSPTKLENEDVPKNKGRNKSSSRGRGTKGRPRKNKEDMSFKPIENTCDAKENSELFNPELTPGEISNNSLKLKISNKISNEGTDRKENTDSEDVSEQVASPAGKILKTTRAERKSDYSPPKITKFGEVGSSRKNRRPSPLKTLSKGSKLQKGSAVLPTTAKSGPFDVFDFDDEPEDEFPTTLKSFATKSKEQSGLKYQNSPEISKSMDFEQQDSPSKAPTLKLKLGKGKDKKSKTEHSSDASGLGNDIAYSEMTSTKTEEWSVPEVEIKGKVEGKKNKKTTKSRKKSKKGKAIQDDIEAEQRIPSVNSTLDTTDSELNTSQEPESHGVRKISDKKSKKSKKKSAEVTNSVLEQMSEGFLSSPDHMVIDTQQSVNSASENDGDKSDKEYSNIQKEHVGLEKTIKALHERLSSKSPVRLPAVLPGYEDIDPVVTAKDKKVKSKKRGRDGSFSETEALDLSVQDTKANTKTNDISNMTSEILVTDKDKEKFPHQDEIGETSESVFGKSQQPNHLEMSSQCIDSGKSQNDAQGDVQSIGDKEVTQKAPEHKAKSKKESKSRKRSKDEAKLDQSMSRDRESKMHSDPTPAKQQKFIDESVFTNQENPSELIVKPSSQHLTDSKKSHDKERKSRKRAHSSKSKSKEDSTSGILLEGSIPETITFSENDLFAVLDQVEGSSKIEDDQPISQSVDEVPEKKAKGDLVEDNSAISDNNVINYHSSETLKPESSEETNTVPLYAQDLIKEFPVQESSQEITKNKDSSKPCDGTSPNKKEKKKDRKKRRKERHAVREMSENDLSQSEPFVIPDMQPPLMEILPNNYKESSSNHSPKYSDRSVVTTASSSASLTENPESYSITTTANTKDSDVNKLSNTSTGNTDTSDISERDEMTSTSLSNQSNISATSESVSTPSISYSSEAAKEFKVPLPVSTSESTTITARGNPPRPLERTTTSHLVARIPKKRIDAYQMEYENATIQQPMKSNNTNSEPTTEPKQPSDSNSEYAAKKPESNTDKNNMFDAFGPTSSVNPYGTDFSYDFAKPVVPSPYVGNPPSSSTNLNFINMDDNSSISTIEEKKDSEESLKTTNNSVSNKFMDFDYIPPSPLSSARHSHLGSLAQVAQLRATSIVMPASPRPPMGSIGSRSSKKEKEKSESNKPSKDTKENVMEKGSSTEMKNNSGADSISSMNLNSQVDNSNKGSTPAGNSNSLSQNIPQNSNNSDLLSQQMPPPQMPPPPEIPPNDKSNEKEVDKINEQLQDPYSPDVNYTSEPLFSPPSILPPDSVNQEHEHSPTMPAVPTENNPTKPKEAAPAPQTSNTVYPGNNYMDTAQGMDLSQRTIYNQDTNTGSSTCALQQAKQQQGIYDNFSPPYASQASSGPSPSMGSSNPGSNQMLSPNMNSSVVNTATTSSYTTSSPGTQMAGQRGYSSYYPMPSSTQQPPPGPPPPLMQPSYGMETTQRDNTRSQNRTPGMVNSDRMTSPHPSNQPKNYSSYMSQSDNHTTASQHAQQREAQRLNHPEKEARSQRSTGVHSGQMSNAQGVGNSQRNRSSSVGGRASSMSNDNRSSSHSNQYYPQTSYSNHSGSQLTSPPLHHRGPAPSDQQPNSSSQRSSYDIPYSAASAAYGALASYSSPYNNSQSLTGNSSSSHSQSVPPSQQHKSSSHSQRTASAAAPKNMQSNKQPPAAHSGSHHRQQQQQTPSMQQSVKSSANRTSSSSSKSSSAKKSSSSKAAYSDMDPAMMSSMFDARSMTPYFFNSLHSPSSRNFHTEANPYFSGMFSNHQRQSSQHKSSDMNNPFSMFPHSRSQNGIGFNWTGMNPAHNNHHTSTSQSAHSNSSAHLSGFNFNLFGAPEMNSSHSQDISPMKLPHSQLLSQHGMDHNAAALQHQSFYQNRGQMASSMLHNPMSFLGHQHPGFDSRSMSAGTMGAHFGGHGPGFSMPFLPD